MPKIWIPDDQPINMEFLVKPHMVRKAMSNDRRYDVFHPSAWGQCLRKIAYQHYNEKDKFVQKDEASLDIRVERLYDNGHGMHARWQSYLDNAGVLRGYWKCENPLCGKVYGESEPLGIFNPIRTEKSWSCECGNSKKLKYEEVLVHSAELNFEGHVDAIVDVRGTPYRRDNKLDLLIVDFKTMNKDEFKTLEKPKNEHVVQVHIYMWLKDIHGAVVLYEDKNNQALKELYVPRNEAMVNQIKSQAAWLIDVLAQRKLPHRPEGFTMSAPPCRFCEFANICYA